MVDRRVLVVDDDASIRGYLALRIMLEEGFELVAEAVNGRDGIELAAVHQPDIVVLDYRMPVVNGLEALPRIREVAPGARVIMLSGEPDHELRQLALEAGAAAFVSKGSEGLVDQLRGIAA